MKNEKRIPFETIEKVVEGEPEAIHNVVCYYRGYMVSAKYSCGFSNLLDSSIIVNER